MIVVLKPSALTKCSHRSRVSVSVFLLLALTDSWPFTLVSNTFTSRRSGKESGFGLVSINPGAIHTN